jgi:hypothetical protein
MTTTFNYDPYFDDFDEDKNFMRVLFKPGYSVQSRELTQLQTILSDQIEKFGNHIFKSGSPIIGGKISLDDRAYYLVLNSQYNDQDIDVTQFEGKIIVGYNTTKSVRAKVIAVDNSTTNPILVLKYLTASVFEESDEIKVYGQNIFAQAKDTSAVGRSYVASILDGVYYFKGQFVKVVPQFLVLELFYKIGYNASTTNKQPSYKIGIEFEPTIVDYIDDSSLLDPAQGAFNYQAPGADRFAINTRLSKRTLDSADESSFFEVIRIVDGIKTKEVEYPIYSEIEKTLARRTYEESGNYTVDPFVLSLEETAYNANNEVDPNYFTAVLDPGKGYVGGYELQTIAPTKIKIPRARQTNSVNQYDLPTNYNSTVAIETLFGTLNITAFPVIDIHCTTQSTINSSGTTEYESTKIGTARVDMLKYNDATDSNDGTTHSFLMHLFDVNSTPITGTLQSSGHTTTSIKFDSDFSGTATANSYANMYFRITDGAGTSLSPIRIVSSDASTKTLVLSQALPFTPSSNTFSIESDFKVAKSFSVRTGSSISFSANINSDSISTEGFAYINEPKRTSLIFDTPYQSIKADTIENLDFYARKLYSNKVSSAGGIITIETDGTDTFAFAGSPGSLSDPQILNNIVCFVRSDSVEVSADGIFQNRILSLANSAFTVTAISSSQIDIDVGAAGVRADFLITTKINSAESGSTGAIRGKQLLPLSDSLHEKVPYNLGDPLNDGLDVANTGTVTTVTGGYVFQDVGGVFFDTPATVTQLKTPGVSVSLNIPDVYEIVKIIDSRSTGNVTTAMLTDDAYDVTNNYEFDNGQRKTHYDHASIKLKRGYSSPVGSTIYVQLKYLKHQSAPSPQNNGLFTVDSYVKTGSNFTYDDMSRFLNSEDGKFISMRSCLDFRPTRGIGSDTLSGALNVEPDYTAEFDFEYYLSRIDRIVAKPSKEFVVISGKSDVNPVPPPVQPTDMLLYTLSIPAYTETTKEIVSEFKNNRRFTMNDIGSFENRIKGLEYYVALSSLEKNAADSKVLDANGLERSKYGIVVDNFTNRDVQATYGDAGFDNRNLIENGELKPASLMRTFKLKWSEANSTGSFVATGVNDQKSLMLDYTTDTFAEQKYATKFVPVASALFANFNGKMKLFPEFTSEVDTGHTAQVTLDSLNGIDSAFNFINDAFKWVSDQNPTWVNDADNPFAKIVDSKWFETVTTVNDQTVDLGNWTRGNLQTTTDQVFISQGAELNMNQISTSKSTVDVGTFITDLSIQPYIKPVPIIFNATGLKPNSRYYSFFDKVSVDNYIVNPTKLRTTSSDIGGRHFISGEFALISDSPANLNIAIGNYNSGITGGYKLVRVTNVEIVTDSLLTKVDDIHIVNEVEDNLDGQWLFGLDSKSYFAISSVTNHKSGLTRAVGTSTITLAADAPSVDISGNTVTLVHSTDSDDGHGVTYTVTSYNTSTKVATISGTTSAIERAKTWTYSIGNNNANARGDLSGVFYPPAATFRNGERNFRVTESSNDTYDTDAISFAEKTFVSSGVKVNKTNLLNTVYNVDVGVQFVGNATSDLLQSTSTTSRITNTWSVPRPDPLAQTFYVDPDVYPNGMFISNTKLFFRSKDTDLPVTIQIRPTVNGSPSSDFAYPESIVVKYPTEVITSDTPDVNNSETYTQFDFKSPVYLAPGLYALVILTDSPDYSVWVAEKGKTTLNNEYVSINPYVGTLYKSQNTMEYAEYLNEDLMFTMDRCVFSSSAATFSLQTETQNRKYYFDKFRVLTKTLENLTNGPTTITYSFVSTDTNGIKETSYREIQPFVTYSLGSDTLYSIGNKRKQIQNQSDFNLSITISSTDNAVSPLISLESLFLNAWENFVDNAEVNTEDFNIIAPGSGYANTHQITINSSTGTGAQVYFVVDNSPTGNVVGINVASAGSGYYDDFTISYPLAGESTVTSNASIILNTEYDSSGGPCLARYITKPITLADGFDAGDLRVFLSANRPGNSEIHVYYKLLSGSDTTSFKDRPYQKMECFNPSTVPSLTDTDYREFEYRPSLTDDFVTYTSDSGVTYDSFKTFSIKIVMTTNDTTVVPKVKDLRIIALPAG